MYIEVHNICGALFFRCSVVSGFVTFLLYLKLTCMKTYTSIVLAFWNNEIELYFVVAL